MCGENSEDFLEADDEEGEEERDEDALSQEEKESAEHVLPEKASE